MWIVVFVIAVFVYFRFVKGRRFKKSRSSDVVVLRKIYPDPVPVPVPVPVPNPIIIIFRVLSVRGNIYVLTTL